MKTILWCQGESTNTPDLYFFKGEVITDIDQRLTLSRELSYYRDFGMYHKNNIKQGKKEERIKENTFISYTERGIFISSNYLTEDEAKRQIVFEFYCETNDISSAIKELVKASQIINKECDIEELEELKKIVEEPEIEDQKVENSTNKTDQNNFTYNKIIIFLAIIIITIFCSKTCNNSDQERNPIQTDTLKVEQYGVENK